MAPRVPRGDSGFLLTSTSAQDMAILVGPTQQRVESIQPAPVGLRMGQIPPKSHTWRGPENFIELAEVGDEAQAVRLCHGGHLSTGEHRLDAQLLLCYVQHHLVGPNGILWVH